jgi:hypothetical protein
MEAQAKYAVSVPEYLGVSRFTDHSCTENQVF